jgi:hypothetical protein
MLGLGPRLKVRPPLLDLIIANRGVVEASSLGRASIFGAPPPVGSSLSPAPHPPGDQTLQVLDSPTSNTSLAGIEPPLSHSRSSCLAMAPQGKQTKLQEVAEDQYGSIFSVSGPVVVAENMIGCAMYEMVSILEAPLLVARAEVANLFAV